MKETRGDKKNFFFQKKKKVKQEKWFEMKSKKINNDDTYYITRHGCCATLESDRKVKLCLVYWVSMSMAFHMLTLSLHLLRPNGKKKYSMLDNWFKGKFFFIIFNCDFY